MHPDPKRDAQKTEKTGRQVDPQAKPRVAKPDAAGGEGIEIAREQRQKHNKQNEQNAPSPARPRQDSLDLQRASSEGMTAPPSER